MVNADSLTVLKCFGEEYSEGCKNIDNIFDSSSVLSHVVPDVGRVFKEIVTVCLSVLRHHHTQQTAFWQGGVLG